MVSPKFLPRFLPHMVRGWCVLLVSLWAVVASAASLQDEAREADTRVCTVAAYLLSSRPVFDDAVFAEADEPSGCNGSEDGEADLGEDALAPMCDTTAASVPATNEVPEADTGWLAELPCDGVALLLYLSSLQERGEHGEALSGQRSPGPERSGLGAGGDDAAALPALVVPMEEYAAGKRMGRSHAFGLTESSGYALGIFRPPALAPRA